jgi:hypothetical protein
MFKLPITPPFTDMLNACMQHFVRELHPEQDVHVELEKANA